MQTHRIAIPAGVPPYYLPTSAPEVPSSEEPSAPTPDAETPDPSLFEALQAGEKSGLLDSSAALESRLGGEASTPRRASAPRRAPTPSRPQQGGGVPSDDEILSWARRVREHGKRQGVLYLNSALKYWVRYTFHSYTPEYRAVGQRIDAIVRDA